MQLYQVILPEKSTVNLHDALDPGSGHFTGMDLRAILKRIEERAQELGTTPNAAGTAAGKPWAVPNIKKAISQGRSSVALSTIAVLAKPLKVSTAWLLEGVPDDHVESGDILPERKPAGRTVPIKGYVGAGSVAHFYALADEDYEEVEAPLGASDQTVAVEIKGKSFGPLMDSWVVFYDDVRSPVTEDLIGKICVVGLVDDRILIKQVKRERDGSFTLLSNSNEEPIRNAMIEWAARVTDMRPR